MKKALCVSTLLSLAGQPLFAQGRPNIVVFLVDDMGLMDTSLPFLTDKSGNPVRYPLNDWYQTPNMERMARQGIRFSRFYAQSVSSPSRASLMTGQNSTRHGTTNWINSDSNNKCSFGPTAWNWNGLSKNDITFPRILHNAGYKTIHVGKAHFGRMDSDGENPQNIGFDINIAGSFIGQPGSYYGENGYGNIKGNKSSAVPGLEKYHGTDVFLSEALTLEANKQIDEAVKEKKPFFLYMSHYAVHAPFEADKRFARHYSYTRKPKMAANFATLIEGMDKSLGDIMDHLEELGIAENTLIIFLGDNGSDAPMGDDKGYSSSAPLRGMKGSEFEGGARVPFITCWGKPDGNNPAQKRLPIAIGSVQQQIGTIMDIYPTILSLVGAENPQGNIIDGIDLSTQLQGRKNKNRSDKVLIHFPHEHHGCYFTTYIDDYWKLIYYYNPERPSEPGYRLYNLKKDPGETLDLSLQDKNRVRKMVQAMNAQLEVEGALYPEDANGNVLKPFSL